MPEHLHYDEEAIVNRDTRHEESDVNVRALLTFVVVFVVFAIFTHLGIWMMFKTFRRILDRPNAPLSQIQQPPDANIPQEPRLQPFPNRDSRGVVALPNRNTPVTDMEEMRAREEAVLQHYGWVDQQKGIVHIPIEQAKQLLLQRGLAVNPAQATTSQTPSVQDAASATNKVPMQSGESNAARIDARSAKP